VSQPLAALITTYLDQLSARLRRGTVRDEGIHLRAFVEWITTTHGVFDVRAVTPQHVEDWRAALLVAQYRRRDGMHRLARSTRYDRLAALQRFFAWAIANRRLLADPSATVARGRRRARRLETILTEAEIMMLLEAGDTRTPRGLRDRAILELLYATGLRRAELVALDLTDIDLAEGVVVVRAGKGGKPRMVPLGEAAREALTLYLTNARPLFLRSPRVTALFLVSNRAGQRGQRLGAGSIRNIVRAAAERADIGKRITPHMFRHAVATHLLRAGAGLRHVQELLGHARIDTTEIYTHLDVTDLAQAHAKSHPRGRKRR
jgi:integrase/recombinase XerD